MKCQTQYFHITYNKHMSISKGKKLSSIQNYSTFGPSRKWSRSWPIKRVSSMIYPYTKYHDLCLRQNCNGPKVIKGCTLGGQGWTFTSDLWRQEDWSNITTICLLSFIPLQPIIVNHARAFTVSTFLTVAALVDRSSSRMVFLAA